MDHRTYSGRIDYLTNGTEETGREWFSVTVQPDGARTLRAICEMEEPKLMRDVTYSLGSAWQPLDCFVRLMKAGTFMGSAWFRFTDDAIECEAVTAETGRISQRISVERRVRIFASHPLITDGWQTTQFDHARSEAVQKIEQWAHSSSLPDGGSGPMAGTGYKIIKYRGEEEITVPVGTFACRRYDLQSMIPSRPPLEAWVHGEDHQLVKMHWDLRPADYVLAEWRPA